MRGETSARVSGFGGSAKDEEEALPSCIFCAPSVGFGSELSFDYVAIGILVYGRYSRVGFSFDFVGEALNRSSFWNTNSGSP
jgi:hypothetical protein